MDVLIVVDGKDQVENNQYWILNGSRQNLLFSKLCFFKFNYCVLLVLHMLN